MEEIQIEQIRFDLTWRIRHEVMYPDQAFDLIKLDNDQEGIHFGLFAHNQLTAVISLFHTGKVYQFRKFATITSQQGKGYGSELLQYVIDYVKGFSAEKLWCRARVSASKLYSKFGFVETGQRSAENGIDFVIMELQIKD